MLVAACANSSLDPETALPERIGGVKIAYNRVDGVQLLGDQPDHWALRVAKALQAPPEKVAAITGYRDARSSYNSDIIQVRGATTADLLDAAIRESAFTGERRTDDIGGKSVIRAASPGWTGTMDDTPYFYAFGDIVVMLVADPPLAREALEQLP